MTRFTLGKDEYPVTSNAAYELLNSYERLHPVNIPKRTNSRNKTPGSDKDDGDKRGLQFSQKGKLIPGKNRRTFADSYCPDCKSYRHNKAFCPKKQEE